MLKYEYNGIVVTAASKEEAVEKIIARSGRKDGKARPVKVKKIERNRKVRKVKAGVNGTITMQIDYVTFMRLLDSAAYFSGSDEYKNALWDWYSEEGSIGGEAYVFFDNLFQYTSWWDHERLADEIKYDGYEPEEGESAEDFCKRWLSENDNELRGMYIKDCGDNYLVIQ